MSCQCLEKEGWLHSGASFPVAVVDAIGSKALMEEVSVLQREGSIP